MALITTKQPSVTKWLFKANNHILEFYSDDVTKTQNYAEITITGITNPIVIYPNPEGRFWFNFSKFFNALISDVSDDIDPTTIDEADIDTFVFDWSKCVSIPTITWKVYHTDVTSVETSALMYIIAGVEDLLDYKKGVTKNGYNNHYLTPISEGSTTRMHLRYWHGYPFDIGLSQAIPNKVITQKWKNLTNGIETPDMSTPYEAQRIFISNGDTNKTLEDYLPLVDGYNEIRVPEPNLTYAYIDLWKETESCGVYLKWFNPDGGYNYWLFSRYYSEQIRTKGLGMINADFSDNEDTVSPQIGVGREADRKYSLFYDNLTPEDVRVLSGLFRSHKVYLFTGVPFSANDFNDWIEVEVSDHLLTTRDEKGRVPKVSFQIELPKIKTVQL